MRTSIKVAALAGLCTFAVTGTALARCMVDPGDFAALRQSRSAVVDQRSVDALSDNSQALLCSTRALVRDVEKNDGHLSSEPGQFSTAFMSPHEVSLVDIAVTEWVAAAEKSQHRLIP